LDAFAKFVTMMTQFMSSFLYSHITVMGLSFALVLIFSARNVLEIKDARIRTPQHCALPTAQHAS
jgi:hypothetical protein